MTALTFSAPGEVAERVAWSRCWGALHALEESRLEFESFPNYLTAAQVRWAETALEDAIALAGEFQVPGLPWGLS